MRASILLLMLVVGCARTTDTSDSGDTSDTVDTSDSADSADTADTSDTSDTSDTGTATFDSGLWATDVMGQCGQNSDCTSDTCYPEAPGGFCSCESAEDCPTAPSQQSYDCSTVGLCKLSCENNTECPDGMYCKERSSGNVCEAIDCSVEACPAPYVCNESQRCERPICDSACPVCDEADVYCVADHY